MGTTGRGYAAIEAAILRCETVEALKLAIENSNRRLLESARREWELRFEGKDPSDACIRVCISATPGAGRARAGFRASDFSKRPLRANGETRPRLA
jgi:hypothetical protein